MIRPALPHRLPVPAGVLALICCGVALAGVVIAECRVPGPRVPVRPDILGGLPAAQGTAANAMTDGQEALLPSILQRPLFVPFRRPAHNGTAAMPDIRLSGIVVGPGSSRTAIFALPRTAAPTGAMHGPGRPVAVGGRGILAREGDVIGPWRIRRIGQDTVGVEGRNGMTELRPDRERAGGTRAPAASQQDDNASDDPDDTSTIPESRISSPPHPLARSHP